MAVVGKFSLNGYSGRLVMRNLGVTRAINVTFDLGADHNAASDLFERTKGLTLPGGGAEVFPLRTPEASFVVVAGDLGLADPESAEMTVDRARTALENLRRAVPELKLNGELEKYRSF